MIESSSSTGEITPKNTTEKLDEIIQQDRGLIELKEVLPKDNDVLNNIFDIFGKYIDLELGNNFSNTEKDNINFVLFGEIIGTLTKDIDNINNIVFKKIIDFIKSPKGLSVEEIIKKIFILRGKNGGFEKIKAKLDLIIEKKKEDRNYIFGTAKKVLDFIKPNNNETGKNIFFRIKSDTEKIIPKLVEGKDISLKLTKLYKNLLPKQKEKIIEIITWIKTNLPFVWFILSLFIGEGFEIPEQSEKIKKSITNLVIFSKENNFPLKNIKTEELVRFEPKKLKKFYKFLDTKNIDYTKDNFWKGILIGGSKNEKINRLNTLLVGNKGVILDGDYDLEDLINKLNILSDLEKNKENEELSLLEKSFKSRGIYVHKSSKTIQNSTIKNGTESPRIKKEDGPKLSDKKPQEHSNLNLERLHYLKFKESVRDIIRLPARIYYKGEIVMLNIKDNTIVLGNSKYKISIIALGFERFEKIQFKNGKFALNGRGIDTDNLIEILDKLLKGREYNYSGSQGLVNFDLKITKIV